MRRWFVKLIAVSFVSFFINGAQALEKEQDLAQLEEFIDNLYLAEARKRVEALDMKGQKSAYKHYLNGKLLFFEGKHNAAMVELRAAIELSKTRIAWKELRDKVALTQEITAEFRKKEGSSKKFVYQYKDQVDELLIAYADVTLKKQLDALTDLFGNPPQVKIQILFCPSIESFSGLTGLTTEQIERTGTVGVSKYGRIMVLSPRILAAGYPWLDTLAHELAHTFISRSSNEKAPIWLHEGIAKLLERRWRGAPVGELTPAEAYLLDRAAKEKRLIPLGRFHPSISYLPNQEDAALAYAQVLSFMLFVNKKVTDAGWPSELLKLLAKGEDIDRAFLSVAKAPTTRLYSWWKQAVSGKRQTPVPAVALMNRLYKRGRATEPLAIKSDVGTEVRRHIRLGDLLRLRGHTEPAAVEYKEALSLSDSPTVEITDRLAGVLLSLERYDETVKLLSPMTKIYPSHATVFLQLGRALAAEGKNEESIKMLKQVDALNPFHPDVNCLQSTLHNTVGRQKEAKIESEHCRLIISDLKRRSFVNREDGDETK